MPIPLALIPAAFKGVVGISQMLSGRNKLDNLERPEYTIPDEIIQAAGMAKGAYADKRFEGQSNLERQTALTQANALAAATSRGGAQYQVGAIQAQSNQAAQAIGAEQAKQNRADQAEFSNMQQILAKYRDQEFQLNKFAPYAQQYNEGREQIGAGQENLFGSLDQAATVATRLLSATQGDSGTGVSVQRAAPATTQTQQRSEYSDTMLARLMMQLAQKGSQYQPAISQILNSVR